MAETHRVLIVEDDADLRESIVRFLMVAGVAAEGIGCVLDFYRSIDPGAYDVAVVDVNLPDQSGFLLADYLRRNTDLGIIIITARDGLEDRVRGYAAGADLYLVKPVDMPELAAAVVSLSFRRRERKAPAPAPSLPSGWTLDHVAWTLISPQGVTVTLSGRERLLVRCLADAAGEPVTRPNLSAALGVEAASSRALDSLVQRLRRKIEKGTGRPAPLENAYGQGYSFAGLLHLADRTPAADRNFDSSPP